MLPPLASGNADNLLIAVGVFLLISTFIRIFLRHRKLEDTTISNSEAGEIYRRQITELQTKLANDFEQLADSKLSLLETRIRVLDALLMRAESSGVSAKPSVLDTITEMLAQDKTPQTIAQECEVSLDEVLLIKGLSTTCAKVKT